MNPERIDELVDHWTLLDDERKLIGNKSGATRLGFGLLLKFYTRYGRFPRGRAELSDDAVDFVAQQIKVESSELGFYEWSGRTVEYHRAQIRKHLGFRECSVADTEKLTDWLVEHVCEAERHRDQVKVELLARCRDEQIEPPAAKRIDRIIRAALHRAEQGLCARLVARIDAPVIERLEALTAADVDDEPASVLAQIKSSPGNVSLESMLAEIDKLGAVRAVGLPDGLFVDVAPKVAAAWVRRAMVESPSHMRTHPREFRLVLLAALVHARQREVTDTLVDLFVTTVHRIGARAHRRVTKELVNAFQKVSGKENLLFAIAEAAVGHPDDAVRQVVFPAVSGGEATLRDLVHEYKTKGPQYRRTVQHSYKASYTSHYRRGLIKLLEVLDFRSNNAAHQGVLDALDLVARYAGRSGITYYPHGETIPTHRGLTGEWEPLVRVTTSRGKHQTVRAIYEICTFQSLRDLLRCKEIWVGGADKHRNPDEDLPADFELRRVEHYAALRKPLDPAEFVEALRAEMTAELTALDAAVPGLSWLDIADRGKAGAVKLSPFEAAPEPVNLRRLKTEVARRWGTVPLVDMLKEAVLRTGCLDQVVATVGRGDMDVAELAEKLILTVYGYGTNTGIRAVAAGGQHGHSEKDLRYVRARYLSPETARIMATAIADATLAARHRAVWGQASTTVASDSTHFGAFDQNLFTEWHNRYGGRGVLIYWHVEEQSTVIHSQLLNCSASEVAALIDGAIHHGTSMEVEGNYVDSHGQSESGSV